MVCIGVILMGMMVWALGCDSVDSIDENEFILSIEANPTTLMEKEYSSITVTLTRADKTATTSDSGTSITTGTPQPVPGYVVTFSFVQNKSEAKLTVVNAVTDSNGKAAAIYQAGEKAGIDIIQGRIENGQAVSTSIIVSLPEDTGTEEL